MEGSCMASCPSAASTCSGPGLPGAEAVFFTGLITTLLKSEHELGNPNDYPEDATPYLLNEYDFIVVGGGSAGSVVAARLSEIPKWKVLVIEAGGNPPLTSDIPAIFFSLQKTDIDWQFKTQPEEENCQGFRYKRCNWPRGKVLGGTGILNGNLYIRGMKDDFDEWVENGNNGWSYDEVLEYFKKSEDFKPQKNENISPYHGTGGPLTVQRFESLDLAWTLADAFKEAGHEMLDDINGPSQLGFAHLHGTIRNGTRCSTAKAFLGSAKSRKNLNVVKYSQVLRIIIDPDTKIATGVEVRLSNGTNREIKVRKEVILSAGTVNSPQLLMLSGIGPKRHLTEIGIKPIKNLQVGENLQDHLLFFGSIFTITKSDVIQSSPLNFLDASYQYLTRRSGFFSTHYGTTVSGFIKTKVSPEDNRPDIQIMTFVILANDTNSAVMLGTQFDLTEETVESLQEMVTEGDVIMLALLLNRPKSKGKILLASSNPSDYPKIYPGYLSDDRDMETMMEGIKSSVQIMESNTMKKRNVKRKRLALDLCEDLEFDSNDYWKCALRNIATTCFHPVGTCKMGPQSDPTAVVDSELKVHGVKGIRVADASVMPSIVSTPPYATTIMIGEKAAHMIIAEWL